MYLFGVQDFPRGEGREGRALLNNKQAFSVTCLSGSGNLGPSVLGL